MWGCICLWFFSSQSLRNTWCEFRRGTDVSVISETPLFWSRSSSWPWSKKSKELLYIMFCLNQGNTPHLQAFFLNHSSLLACRCLRGSWESPKTGAFMESASLTFRVDKQLQGSGTKRSKSWVWVKCWKMASLWVVLTIFMCSMGVRTGLGGLGAWMDYKQKALS